ncbi:TPA: type IA DNA topoisomerase [Candidatus Geothermarchaeota archaeon]|nr:type IA DNA topoisomerase [Candidatus Geothermarchaeota archaeon]
MPIIQERYIVVAEKPSVARELKKFFRYNKISAITSSVRGHIYNLDFPSRYGWGRIAAEKLFDLVNEIEFKLVDRKSYINLRKIFSTYKGYILVIATDNDSEGELIGYEILRIYEDIRGRGSRYYRMRFNSLDFKELYRAWTNKTTALNWRWVNKALFRTYFDLVTGAAFTRILTISGDGRLISWGSCQTPTLYFVVKRERERKAFKRRKYYYISIKIEKDGREVSLNSQHFSKKGEAEYIASEIREAGYITISKYVKERFRERRPLPTATDYLLRDLTKILKIDAMEILSIAEELYSRGYISYPRTETDKYPKTFDYRRPLKTVEESDLNHLLIYTKGFPKLQPNPRQGRKDDKAHPPIYPVKPYPNDGSRQWRIWEYIARRYIANVYTDDAFGFKQVLEAIYGDIVFTGHGRYYAYEGFYKIFPYFRSKDNPIPDFKVGEKIRVVDVDVKTGWTEPPPRLTEADLLKLMEDHGIGTDATRAIYPRILVKRRYASKRGGRYIPSKLGMNFIELLENIDKRLVTPDTRKYVEDMMKMIEEGRMGMDDALEKALAIYKELFKRLMKNEDEISSYLLIKDREKNG